MKFTFLITSSLFISLFFYSVKSSAQMLDVELSRENSASDYSMSKTENMPPVIGAWFWSEEQFQPNGYKQFIDQVSKYSCYNLLAVAIRRPGREISDIDVHNQVQLAAAYARQKGIRIAVGLDPRLARRKFEALYPNELQQSLWLQEELLSTAGTTRTVVKSIDLVDHMNGSSIPYLSLYGSLLRVYAYNKTSEGIDPQTLEDISKDCKVLLASGDSLVVEMPANKKGEQRYACAMVAFTHLTPDVFAPHLMEFTRNIINSYSDVPLAGGMRDEWGFPPSTPANRMAMGNHFWYSEYYAAEYARATEGRELLADCLLMYAGIKGKEAERYQAINHYMFLNLERNITLENDFYQTIKSVFGSDAEVITHPTWYPYPNRLEFKKNGLYWWAAKRDWAQTDEVTPFGVRTALAKKWGSPIWYNQYYATQRGSYVQELWSSALAGGRINYHPLYPCSQKEKKYTELFRGGLMRGESRVRLLDFISHSPLDCPVAVIFGHAAVMNWAGPYFEDTGMHLINQLWKAGIPSDLIPTSEIENKSLFVDKDGWVSYGKQRYRAVVLYNPEFEKQTTADFFNRAATGNTHLFRVGNWTRNFEGESLDGNAEMPSEMLVFNNIETLTTTISEILKQEKQEFQTSASRLLQGFGYTSNTPPGQGVCRLIDGTLIQISGEKEEAGDVIDSKMNVGQYEVIFNALGVAAVRLDANGDVQALAAGGLRFFKAGDFVINLDQRVDVALWKNENGEFEGVVQGLNGQIPSSLLKFTTQWQLLTLPEKLDDAGDN